MNCRIGIALAALLLTTSVAQAQEGRFDAQIFRPLAAPRDLVMVPKSEVIGHLSPTFGIYADVGLDPLALLVNQTGETVDAVAARLQLTGLVGIGFFDWFDITAAVPFVAWQYSDNLRSIGTEGPVESSTLGDVRLTGRVSLPFLNRKKNAVSGFGMAIAGNINLPTGDVLAFASDGVLTGGAQIIADYRFGVGAILTTSVGVWLRPERQIAGVAVGDMASVGVAAEAYVVKRWGLSVIGGAYGYPSLVTFPDSARQIPAEALLALRWQNKHGITWTFGGSFGANCGFGAASFRAFSGVTWQPSSSREQEQINRILERERQDPDQDGLVAPMDRCPELPGRPDNYGCPELDSDDDGWADRIDECPELAGGNKGCPPAFIRGDEIVILEKVFFATDKDIILDQSKPVLEAVAQVLLANPEIILVRVEGHTDVRASDLYNYNLSQRRSESVRRYLIDQGIVPERLQAKGYGHTQPLYDDRGCLGSDEELSEDCRFMTSENRRVIFRILRRTNEAR